MKNLKGTTAFYSVIPFLAILFLFSGTFSNNEKKSTPVQPFMTSVDNIVADQMVKQNIVGCAVGVVKNGNIVHIKAYGHKDILRTKPVTVNTVFRWASISKPLTAVAAFKAIETHKMGLTDKVTKYVSYWPNSGNKGNITIANLMNHRSGINHYDSYNKSKYTANNNYNAKQCVDVFSSAPLQNTPDTKYYYSTFGFNLLGSTVEEATHVPFESYVQTNIANKAGMTSLTPYSNAIGGYAKNCNGELVAKNEGKVDWKLGGGGWASNIKDLTQFMVGLMNGTFLNNTAALWKSVPSNNNYCYGISRGSLNGELYVAHGGAHSDVRTYMGFFPNSKTGVVVFINGGANVSSNRLAKKVFSSIGKNFGLDDLAVNYCGKEPECGTRTIGVWRKTNHAENTVIRRGYSSNEFHAEWKWLLGKGYYCSNFETYKQGGTRKWDGIFKKKNIGSAMYRNYSQQGFHDKWKEMSNKGYRLIDVETYVDGAARKWAGLFIKKSGAYALYRNMSSQQLHDRWSANNKKGLKLIDIEKYGNQWAGVWVAGSGVAMYRNYEPSAFMLKRREMNKNGWRLIDVETYTAGSKRKMAGLWEKSSQDEKYIFGYRYCKWLSSFYDAYDNQGYELIDLENY
ncbi:MAG: serine hydrolase [Chitinophagaceae bacterium]